MTWDWAKKKSVRLCGTCKKECREAVYRKGAWHHHACVGAVNTLKMGRAYRRAVRWRDAGKRELKRSGLASVLKKG